MKLETNRESTTIALGKFYCFNYDKIIDASIYLAAKDYWENGGGKEQGELYADRDKEFYLHSVDRSYKRLEAALNRCKGMSEYEIFDGWAYGLGGKSKYKYHKTIETLFELRGMMWN